MPRAGGHKYIKRTGSKGSYKYWYRQPDGSLGTKMSGKSEAESQNSGKNEHLERLAAAKIDGHHSMTSTQMARLVGGGKVGHDANRAVQNLKGEIRKRHARAAGVANWKDVTYEQAIASGERHNISSARIEEGQFVDTNSPEYRSKIESILERKRGEAAPASAAAGTSSPARRKPAKRARRRSVRNEPTTNPAASRVAPSPSAAPAPAASSEVASKKDKIKRLREKLAAAGVNLPGSGTEHLDSAPVAPAPVAPAPAPPAVRATQIRAKSRAASSAAVQLAEGDPAVAVAEAPVRRMAETAASGGNPYLSRAKEVFDRIKSSVASERATYTKYMIQAIDAANTGGAITKSAVKAKYQEISGQGNFAEAQKHFEAATFVDLPEILENDPLNLEVERMRRGYPRMQYERLAPFIKDSWHRQHPGGYPPMPTWGDIKTWAEHGTERPSSMSWTTPTGRAGGGTQAMPQEVFDAAIKDATGRPIFPPKELPIHMMPMWNYLAKSDSNPYATGQIPFTGEGQKLELPSQGNLSSHLLNSVRRFIQMRGGVDQLIDIPTHKLEKVGLTQADIFKSELSDAQLWKVMRTKIIDMIELLPIIDAELEKGGFRKSYSLVVDINQPAFKKSTLSEETIKKSLIREIKRLRNEQELSFVSRV